MQFETTPGRASAKQPELSASPNHQWTCVVIAHPHCPCTAASLKAIRSLAAGHKDEISVRTVLVSDQRDLESPNYRLAIAIPGGTAEWLTITHALERYDAHTSGQVFIFSSSGKLAYSGGVTPARGIDQPRFAAQLFERIKASDGALESYPVFGCPLGETI